MFLTMPYWIRRPARHPGRLAAAVTIGLTLALAGSLPAAAQQSTVAPRPSATQDLFNAIFARDMAAAQSAVGAGADLSVRNDWGLTAIDLAIDKGYYDIAHYLLSIRNFRRQQAGDEQRPAPPPAIAAPEPPGALPGPGQASPAPAVQSGPLPRVGQVPAAPAAAPAPARQTDQGNPFVAGSVIPGQPAIIGNIQGPGAIPAQRPPATPEQAPAPQPAPRAGTVTVPDAETPPAPQLAPAPEATLRAVPPAPAVPQAAVAPAPPTEASSTPTDTPPVASGLSGFWNQLKSILPSASTAPEASSTSVATPSIATPSAAQAAAESTRAQAAAAPASPGSGNTPMPLAVSLRLSDDVNLDRKSPGGENCVTKHGGDSFFCIEPVTWPAALRKAFETNTILYQGSRAIVRYDGHAATSLYAVFGGGAFDAVTGWAESQFGPPTSATTQRLAVPGKSPLENRIRVWRSRDPASGDQTALELRSIDNVRNAFPDAEHGVLMLYREGAAAIFPQLSAIDLMMLR